MGEVPAYRVIHGMVVKGTAKAEVPKLRLNENIVNDLGIILVLIADKPKVDVRVINRVRNDNRA
jgi:hypothetical protein